ncbi:MAG: hypothetical protein HFJ75_04975 [Eggerthellaceae bacterium]|nr:hypothetical protein [Eggerthellaceae bacterium]
MSKSQSLLPAWSVKVAAAVCALVAVATFCVLGASGQARGDGSFSVNEAGQTYGVTAGLAVGEQYPDLMEVRATNDKIGYIYRTDEEAASGGWVSSPEEAAAYMEERNAKLAVALQEACNKRLSEEEAISLEGARETLVAIEQGGLLIPDPATGAPTLEGSSVEALGEPSVLMEAYLEALESEVVYIPVYEADGVTQIGVFPIG